MLTEKEQDYLCSAGFVAMGCAEVIFRRVYNHLKDVLDEEAMTRKDYKELKKKNPMQAKMLRDEMAKKYFTDEQRSRYKSMMQHIGLLMKDFEWVDSYAMFDHLKVKLKPTETINLFDALINDSNQLARLLFLWADYQENHPEDKDDIMIESFLKMQTKTERCGHLAHLFRMGQ